MPVTTEARGTALVIRLERPDKRNAIDRDMAVGLAAALDRLEGDDDLRVGVLCAAGPVFCAGTDMFDSRDKFVGPGGEYGMLRRDRRKPLIAAVDGPALGGGFEIVLACDLAVASTSATFGLPETRRGLAATGGGLFRLLGALATQSAAELLLAGAPLTADRLYQLGVVNRLVEPGGAEAAAHLLAAEIAQAGPAATGLTLQALRRMAGLHDDVGWSVTGEVKAAVLAGPEVAEGRRAFAERRRPAWVVDPAASDPAVVDPAASDSAVSGHTRSARTPEAGQRRGRRIAMSQAERDDFLATERVCRVASQSAQGPHVTPLWFFWDGSSLWLNSVVRSQRWADLRADPRVAVVVDAGEAYEELRGVEMSGEVQVVGEVPRTGAPVADSAALDRAESGFHRKYRDPDRDIPYDGAHAWLRLTPRRLVSWDFRKRPVPVDATTEEKQ